MSDFQIDSVEVVAEGSIELFVQLQAQYQREMPSDRDLKRYFYCYASGHFCGIVYEWRRTWRFRSQHYIGIHVGL